MFKNYLQTLKEDKNSKQLYEAMDNMQSLIRQMGIMVDGLGKKVIANKEDINYDILLKQQMGIQARELAKKICESFKFRTSLKKSEENIEIVYSMIKNALNRVREKCADTGFIEEDEIIELAEIELFADNDIDLTLLSISFFQKWEESIAICDNAELSEEVLKILKNDSYSNRLFDYVDYDMEQ